MRWKSYRSLTQSITAALLCGSPALASAMAQCPPEAGEKSAAFWALGWAILTIFVLAGLALPLLTFKVTRSAQRGSRWTLRIASVPAMLAMWLLGSGLFLSQFVLVC